MSETGNDDLRACELEIAAIKRDVSHLLQKIRKTDQPDRCGLFSDSEYNNNIRAYWEKRVQLVEAECNMQARALFESVQQLMAIRKIHASRTEGRPQSLPEMLKALTLDGFKADASAFLANEANISRCKEKIEWEFNREIRTTY